MFLFINNKAHIVLMGNIFLAVNKLFMYFGLLSKVNAKSSIICLFAFSFGASSVLLLAQLLTYKALFLMFVISTAIILRWPSFRPLVFAVAGFIWLNVNAISAVSGTFKHEFERVDMVINGDVVGLPAKKGDNYHFRFKVTSVDEAKHKPIIGKLIQLSCYRCFLNFHANEEWQLTVRLKRPHGYASWGAFDYEKYLFRHRLIAKGYIRLKHENTLINEDVSGPTVWRQSIRERIQGFDNSVGRNMFLALTIGDKSGFSNHQQQTFQASGVSHLMAISGLHVGLVFVSVVFLFKWVSWPFARVFEYYPRPHLVLFPAFMVSFLYAALAGFAVSTQRALIMLAVYLACRLFARQLSLLNILMLAVFLLLLIDPFSVMDVGFWLSCGAIAVIAVISNNDNSVFSSDNSSLALVKLQPILWLGMLPMGVVFFGKLSFVSPIVNLLAVPLFCTVLIPITLVLIIVDLMGGTIVTNVLIPLIIHCFNAVFHCLEFIVSLPFASDFVTPLLWWQWLLFTFFVVLFVGQFVKLAFLVGIFFVASILAKPVTDLSKDELQIVLLDVGQGLAMVIETPNTVSIYDTGPKYSSGFTVADAVLLPYLRRRGIEKIDNLIISHADNDHIGGYQAVQDAFLVERVLSSRVDKVPEADLCKAGQSWKADATKFTIIGPAEGTPEGSNNLSCVLKIEHLGVTVLLTGDIEKKVERFMVRNNKRELRADIMLVPHQGSKTSSTNVFLDAVSPTAALLAAGYKNHYGHPHASVLERYEKRGIKVFSTIESGSVLLKVNSQGWRFIEYRQAQQRFWFD